MPCQIFKCPSSFLPNIQDASIVTFEKQVLKELTALEACRIRTRHNISKEQRIHLEQLAQDKSITIKPADKGGGIVILDKDTYTGEALKTTE